MKIISNGDGTGKPKNPNKYLKHDAYSVFPKSVIDENNKIWHDFEQNNPPLPIYKDNKPYMVKGEVECEVGYQYLHVGKFWKDCPKEQYEKMKALKDPFPTRMVYSVLPSESESKDMAHTLYTEPEPDYDEEQNSADWYQPLFDLMAEHGLTLLLGEMDEIIECVNKMQKKS